MIDYPEFDKIVEFLKILGLNLYEAKAYVALYWLSLALPKALYRSAGVPQPRIYDTMESLERKGWVKRRVATGEYVPLRPLESLAEDVPIRLAELEKNTQELEKRIDVTRRQISIISDYRRILASLQRPPHEIQESVPVTIVEGIEALSHHIHDAMSNVKKNVVNLTKYPPLVFSSIGPTYREILRVLESGINFRRILSLDYLLAQGLAKFEREEQKGERYKLLPKEQILTRFYIFDESRSIHRFEKDAQGKRKVWGIVSNDVGYAQMLLQHFDYCWKTGVSLKTVVMKIRNIKLNLKSNEKEIFDIILEEGPKSIHELGTYKDGPETSSCSLHPSMFFAI